MKKKIAVFAFVTVLMLTLSVVAFAEEATDPAQPGGETVWNLWSLLNPSNLNILQLLTILVSTVATALRMIGGAGGLKSLLEMLGTALKNLIPH